MTKWQTIRCLTAEGVREELRQLRVRLGGIMPLLQHIGVTRATLHNILNGGHEPSEAVAAKLGYERKTVYVKAKKL